MQHESTQRLLETLWPLFRDRVVQFQIIVKMLSEHARRTPHLDDAVVAVRAAWGRYEVLRYLIDDYNATADPWLVIGAQWIDRLDDKDAIDEALQFTAECAEAWEDHFYCRDYDFGRQWEDWDDYLDMPALIDAVRAERWQRGDPEDEIDQFMLIPVEYEYGYDHGVWVFPGTTADLVAAWKSGHHPPADYFDTRAFAGRVKRGLAHARYYEALEESPVVIHLHEDDDSGLTFRKQTRGPDVLSWDKYYPYRKFSQPRHSRGNASLRCRDLNCWPCHKRKE